MIAELQTETFLEQLLTEQLRESKRTVNFMVKPNELLVTVSSTHYCAYTSVLSNWSSSSALIRYLNLGRSHLGEGFTLICIQRLS